jgi:hypothetical protein
MLYKLKLGGTKTKICLSSLLLPSVAITLGCCALNLF